MCVHVFNCVVSTVHSIDKFHCALVPSGPRVPSISVLCLLRTAHILNKPFCRPPSPSRLCGCWRSRQSLKPSRLLPSWQKPASVLPLGARALTPMASSSPPPPAAETRLANPEPWRCSPPLRGSPSCRICISSESPGSSLRRGRDWFGGHVGMWPGWSGPGQMDRKRCGLAVKAFESSVPESLARCSACRTTASLAPPSPPSVPATLRRFPTCESSIATTNPFPPSLTALTLASAPASYNQIGDIGAAALAPVLPLLFNCNLLYLKYVLRSLSLEGN